MKIGAGNEHFLLLGRILLSSTGFTPYGRFGGRGRVVRTWWGQQARWKEVRKGIQDK